MVILLLTFITLFLAIFSPCLVVLDRYEKKRRLEAGMGIQNRRAEVENQAAWRRNKQTILG